MLRVIENPQLLSNNQNLDYLLHMPPSLDQSILACLAHAAQIQRYYLCRVIQEFYAVMNLIPQLFFVFSLLTAQYVSSLPFPFKDLPSTSFIPYATRALRIKSIAPFWMTI